MRHGGNNAADCRVYSLADISSKHFWLLFRHKAIKAKKIIAQMLPPNLELIDVISVVGFFLNINLNWNGNVLHQVTGLWLFLIVVCKDSSLISTWIKTEMCYTKWQACGCFWLLCTRLISNVLTDEMDTDVSVNYSAGLRVFIQHILLRTRTYSASIWKSMRLMLL